jgi:hypothetical protein
VAGEGQQQERFARLARAHMQNNTGLNAVLEPCGRGVHCSRRARGERRETADPSLLPFVRPPAPAVIHTAASLFLTASACVPSLSPRPLIQCHTSTLLLPPARTHQPLALHASAPPLIAPHSHCDLGARETDRVSGRRVVWEARRDGGRWGWRRRRWREAGRLDATPRQGPAPGGLLLHHQPSSMA